MYLSIRKEKIQIAIDYLLLVILVVFPIAMNISLISPKDTIHPLISINFSISDFLLLIVFVFWLTKVLIYKELKQIRLPIAPIIVFVGVGTFSIVSASIISDWIKEWIKLIEYFVIFYILLLNNLKQTKIGTIKNILFISTTIILLTAFVQHIVLNGSPYLIRGLFDNRNILGAYLCMTIPLVFAEFLYEKSIMRNIWFILIFLIAMITILSISALFSLLISALIISLVKGRVVFFKLLTGLIVLSLIYFFALPQKNICALQEFVSIYEQGKVSENYYRTQTILYDLKKTIYFSKKLGENNLVISNDLFMSSILPNLRIGDAYIDMNGKKNIKNSYLEMKASLNMIANNPLLGVGLGNFQNQISANYIGFPKINTTEPDKHNGYLLIGTTTGILGLGVLFWIFLSTLKTVYNKFITSSVKHNKKVYLGLLGSIIACMIENFFTSLFVGILLVPFITLIFLSTKNNLNEVEL